MSETVQRYVIIGNGIAGTTAAETLRRGDPHGSIVLITDEPYTLYNRVALPPFLKLQVPESKVFLKNREFHEKNRIELYLETRVTHVDTRERVVYTREGKAFPYDKLLVATGGRPNRLQVPGAEHAQHVYNFQYLDDAKRISARIAESKVGVVTGGSYIAYELAEAFRSRGLETYWLIRGPRFLRYILEEDGGKLVDLIAREHGVHMLYGTTIEEIYPKNGACTVRTNTGQHIDADLVGVGLGLKMNYDFLAETPIKTNTGILTNEYLETDVPGVYAAGDIAEFFDPFANTAYTMGTWASATRHGKLAATNMLGGREPYHDVPYYTSGLFDSRLSAVGLTPDVLPGLEAIHTVDWERRTYRRLFFRDGRLVGVMLIGDLKPKAAYTDIIRSRKQFAESERAALLTV
ncbi:MAG TPA: FAD-dependent oxidoreductase [Chloroflexota bacterium]|nr:FAD-dependent oxidoreductase [Chloroflexota bacterium]